MLILSSRFRVYVGFRAVEGAIFLRWGRGVGSRFGFCCTGSLSGFCKGSIRGLGFQFCLRVLIEAAIEGLRLKVIWVGSRIYGRLYLVALT